MQTLLRSDTTEVKIDTDGPVVIIGEKINPTGRKKLAQALREGNFDYVQELAARQVEAGADVLDVNIGVPGLDEVALLPQVVKAVASRVEVPICVDSANHEALAAGKDRVECEIDGRSWTQKPFPYQGKCLQWLREDYARLDDTDRRFVDTTLRGTGCEALFVA